MAVLKTGKNLLTQTLVQSKQNIYKHALNIHLPFSEGSLNIHLPFIHLPFSEGSLNIHLPLKVQD